MLIRMIDALINREYASRDTSQDVGQPTYDITDSGAVILHEDALKTRLEWADKKLGKFRQAEETK